MTRILEFALVALSFPCFAITPDAKEFLEISKTLEPVQCQKRQLRRQLVQAEVEKRAADAETLKKKFAALNADRDTTKLEKRLAVLEARLLDSNGKARHAEDLDAISFQQREAFYRCE